MTGGITIPVAVRVVPTEFESNGQLVRGDVVVPERPGRYPVICKFHGLPGSPDQVSGIASSLARHGFAVLTFDFRGFRRSEGCFSLAGMVEDAHAAVTHILGHDITTGDWVGVYGASFGGAIAVCAAARDPRVKAVCVRAPVYDTHLFATTPRVMTAIEYTLRESPSAVHGLDDPVLRETMLRRLVEESRRFNPACDIGRIPPRPFLVVTGDSDELIELDGVRALFARAGGPKQLVVVPGADHVLSSPAARTETDRTVVSWFRKAWEMACD